MSKMDTEVIATAAFKLAISKTDLLSPFVNEKDKEPSWDGHIYIYSDKRKTKENIKRVPVQVKGKAVNRRKVKEHITHDIDYDDLMAYLSDGGAIYVVVYIDETTGEPLQIYYISLLPEKIKNILKKENKGKSQRFKKFPSNKTDIEDLFLTFYTNSKQQVSFAKKATIPPDIFAKRRDFTGFSFNLISSSKPIAISELPKYLEGKDLTLYGHLRNVDIPIPVDYIDEVHDVEVTQQVYTPISVNGIKYYDTYSRCYFKDKIVLQIGSCITITINEGEDGKFILPYQVDYKVVGTLSERIKGLNFVMAAIQNKGFSFGEADFSFNDNDEGFKSFNMDNLVNTLNGYKKAKMALELSSVVKEPDLDHFTDADYVLFNKFIASVVDKKTITGTIDKLNKITALRIGNLNLAVAYTLNSADSYIIWDIFHTHLEARLINNDTGVETRVSQFIWMTKEDFLQYDNLNLSFILEDFQSIPAYDGLFNDATLVALELIKAYDQSKATTYLNSAKELFDWIEGKNGIPKEIILINQLQIALRQRKLSYEEDCQLHDLINTTTDLQIKCCAFILLNQQNEAQKILDTFDEDTKRQFEDYPIYYFYRHDSSSDA